MRSKLKAKSFFADKNFENPQVTKITLKYSLLLVVLYNGPQFCKIFVMEYTCNKLKQKSPDTHTLVHQPTTSIQLKL